ncbi:hypothetical protein AABB24_028089 [Solanum stoloniferum]|uniref:Uncharacterized protein n=1 Tax=Solanum stoloniferum TaxID=62892 RepID=A0ABD2S515_9SOLN
MRIRSAYTNFDNIVLGYHSNQPYAYQHNRSRGKLEWNLDSISPQALTRGLHQQSRIFYHRRSIGCVQHTFLLTDKRLERFRKKDQFWRCARSTFETELKANLAHMALLGFCCCWTK